MTQNQAFLDVLTSIVSRQESAALIAQTADGHIAAISIKRGYIQALRCNNKVGRIALSLLQETEIRSFSRQRSCPIGRQPHLSLSTVDILQALAANLLPASDPTSFQTSVEHGADSTANLSQPKTTMLKYRGQTLSSEIKATSQNIEHKHNTSRQTPPLRYRGVLVTEPFID